MKNLFLPLGLKISLYLVTSVAIATALSYIPIGNWWLNFSISHVALWVGGLEYAY